MKRIIIIVISVFLGIFSFSKIELNNIKLTKYETDEKIINRISKKTYMKIWASWCPVCLSSLVETNELYKDELDFNIITIISPKRLGEMEKNRFKRWWDNMKKFRNVEIFFDENGDIINKTDLKAYPTNIFLNSKGEIEKIIYGPINNNIIKKQMKKIK